MDDATRQKIDSIMEMVNKPYVSKCSWRNEESGPPSPSVGPLINFGEVSPGIYRSSFPMSGNFDHLAALGLKTILTLVPTPYPEENIAFMKQHAITHFQVNIRPHKEPKEVIPLDNLAFALAILRNPEHHPVLVHCNKGKHRTGCIIAAYRLLSQWTPLAACAEYRKYACKKARPLDIGFIYKFSVPDMLALLEPPTPTASDSSDDSRGSDDQDSREREEDEWSEEDAFYGWEDMTSYKWNGRKRIKAPLSQSDIDAQRSRFGI
ncbi:MAG: hypothetical protein L6R40_004124 [Gallowayella cf. fulva]|nr:MAG: hypothetical protein L6R40_004124 [Xanthomendoza cf. fulva]